MDEQLEFDLFLAHNSLDKPQINIIKNHLKRRKLKPWIDEEQILAGQSFQKRIQYAIPRVKAAAIFVGDNGLGEWQEEEVELLTSKCKKEDKPVFLVLLPGNKEIPPDLGFLEQRHWVSFDKGFNQALNEIEAGIRQEPIQSFFDVLICYNEEDRFEVQQIESRLKSAEVHLWESGLITPSLQLSVLGKLDQDLSRIWSMVVFVGNNGCPWEQDIVGDIILEFREIHRPVIPVILESVSQESEPAFPVYLKRLGKVDFRQKEHNPVSRLLWGITEDERYR